MIGETRTEFGTLLVGLSGLSEGARSLRKSWLRIGRGRPVAHLDMLSVMYTSMLEGRRKVLANERPPKESSKATIGLFAGELSRFDTKLATTGS